MGCPIDNLSFEETLECIEGFVENGGNHYQISINVHKLLNYRSDPAMREVVERADLLSVDGQPVLWASYLLGTPLKARVAGIDLMEALITRSAKRGWRVFFLGARPEVVERVTDRYRREFPELRIAGSRDGYWTSAEEKGVVDAVHAAEPDVLFVAISSPKKEHFIRQHLERLNVPFVMGVGGSFDVMAGITRRAPRWVRHIGFEWFWRFLQEPRRMWRRYFVEDMRFLLVLASELIKRRRINR
jgi:N-acetylglucosaminyldiphosphoundecaprenol N-acetyl-beta-D-mannosaminyltransferase